MLCLLGGTRRLGGIPVAERSLGASVSKERQTQRLKIRRDSTSIYSNCSSPWQTVYRRYNNGYMTPKLVVRYGYVPNGNICEAGNGDIHVVWEDWDSPLEIGWAKSTDGGQTFSWQEITNTDDTSWPHICPDGALADAPT